MIILGLAWMEICGKINPKILCELAQNQSSLKRFKLS